MASCLSDLGPYRGLDMLNKRLGEPREVIEDGVTYAFTYELVHKGLSVENPFDEQYGLITRTKDFTGKHEHWAMTVPTRTVRLPLPDLWTELTILKDKAMTNLLRTMNTGELEFDL